MKNTILLVGTCLLTVTVACGPQDAVTHDVPGLFQSAQVGLTVQSCTQLPISSVIASGNEDVNPPSNTLDDRLDTRWSNLGKGSWIDYDLGTNATVSGAAIAWHEGNTRVNTFTVSTSLDGVNYTQVYSGRSSGTTTAAETYAFTARTARRLRVTVFGNTLNDWASITEVRPCSGAAAPPPQVMWSGNFETGDRSQWSGTEMVSPDRLQVVSAPAREGHYALKATVRQGDDPINASGNRNELLKTTHEPVGSEYYYGWSTMFAPDFPSPPTWQLFAQWHHEGNNGSPPVEFVVENGRMMLNCSSTTVWSAPLVRGAWQDFVFHAKWSPDPRVGFVELYLNGQLVLPKRYCATQFSGMLNYLKVGLYRDESIAPVGVVYHDRWTMGRQLSDVMPQ